MSTTFLKKYKVLGKVGEGSFSEVLKCQDKETGALYAAKRLKKIKESLADALKTPEVVAMRKLKQHPNILHLIESHFDPFPGKVTLIFELMDMSMYDLMKSRKSPDGFLRYLPESRVKNYLVQLLRGVEHLHRHGLFHRDIKPENILLKNDIVKLADLGSVRGIFCKPPYTEYISTRWYRSPECLLTTGYYGPKMDIWATGCVFFELLTLKPLFPGANEMDQINKIHNVLGTPNARLISKFRRHKSRNCEFFFPSRPGTGVSALLPNVSDGGKDILKQMLVYDPETRPNVRRLLEHRYFGDLREQDTIPQRHSWSVTQTPTTQSNTDWQSQALLNAASTEKRRKSKRTATIQRSTDNQKIARVVSSPNQRSDNADALTLAQASNPKLSTHKKEEAAGAGAPQNPPPATHSFHAPHAAKFQVEKTWPSAISTNALTSKGSFSSAYGSTKKLAAAAAAAAVAVSGRPHHPSAASASAAAVAAAVAAAAATASPRRAPGAAGAATGGGGGGGGAGGTKSHIHLPKLAGAAAAGGGGGGGARHGGGAGGGQGSKMLPARRGPGTITSLPTLESSVGATARAPLPRSVLPIVAPASFLRLPPIVVKKTAAALATASKSLSDTAGGGGGAYISSHASARSILANRHAADKCRLPTIDEKSTVSTWKQL